MSINEIWTGLKSRQHQNKAAQDLLLYVKTELREMPQEELQTFLDEFNHIIFDMISSPDEVLKKGGVLAISMSQFRVAIYDFFSIELSYLFSF